MKEKKRRRRRKQDEVKLPKKAMSKYAIFVKESYEKTKQALKGAKHINIMNKLKDKWRTMRLEEKKRYASLAEQDKRRFLKEYEGSINQIIVNALK